MTRSRKSPFPRASTPIDGFDNDEDTRMDPIKKSPCLKIEIPLPPDMEDDEKVAPSQRQDAMLPIPGQFPPSPPPPPPPSPSKAKCPNPLLFTATKQCGLPFKICPRYWENATQHLTPISLYLCGHCVSQTENRVAIKHPATERTFLNISMCNVCFECNKEMQGAANGVWKAFWDSKKRKVDEIKEQQEREAQEAENKKMRSSEESLDSAAAASSAEID